MYLLNYNILCITYNNIVFYTKNIACETNLLMGYALKWRLGKCARLGEVISYLWL